MIIHYADIFHKITLKRGVLTHQDIAQARCKTRKGEADTRWSRVTCPKCLALRTQGN
jgi:hypothetical protein